MGSGSGIANSDDDPEVEEDDATLCAKPSAAQLDEYLHTNYTDALRDALCIDTCMEEV